MSRGCQKRNLVRCKPALPLSFSYGGKRVFKARELGTSKINGCVNALCIAAYCKILGLKLAFADPSTVAITCTGVPCELLARARGTPMKTEDQASALPPPRPRVAVWRRRYLFFPLPRIWIWFTARVAGSSSVPPSAVGTFFDFR